MKGGGEENNFDRKDKNVKDNFSSLQIWLHSLGPILAANGTFSVLKQS